MPRHYVSPSGAQVTVGTSARENDYITFQVAKPTDYWFHARDFPGAHVILTSTSHNTPAPPNDIQFAADIATKHTPKSSPQSSIAIDYCRVIDVTKPKNAPAGLVVITNANTIIGRRLCSSNIFRQVNKCASQS